MLDYHLVVYTKIAISEKSLPCILQSKSQPVWRLTKGCAYQYIFSCLGAAGTTFGPFFPPISNYFRSWNGKALKAGSRIRTFCDFGFVILEISPVYPEDSGEYTCKAKNALGEAVTTATLKCSGKSKLIMDSQLPRGMEGAMDKIADLEGLGRRR